MRVDQKYLGRPQRGPSPWVTSQCHDSGVWRDYRRVAGRSSVTEEGRRGSLTPVLGGVTPPHAVPCTCAPPSPSTRLVALAQAPWLRNSDRGTTLFPLFPQFWGWPVKISVTCCGHSAGRALRPGAAGESLSPHLLWLLEALCLCALWPFLCLHSLLLWPRPLSDSEPPACLW